MYVCMYARWWALHLSYRCRLSHLHYRMTMAARSSCASTTWRRTSYRSFNMYVMYVMNVCVCMHAYIFVLTTISMYCMYVQFLYYIPSVQFMYVCNVVYVLCMFAYMLLHTTICMYVCMYECIITILYSVWFMYVM